MGIILTTVGLVNNYLIDSNVGYVFSYVLHVLMLYADSVYVGATQGPYVTRDLSWGGVFLMVRLLYCPSV